MLLFYNFLSGHHNVIRDSRTQHELYFFTNLNFRYSFEIDYFYNNTSNNN